LEWSSQTNNANEKEHLAGDLRYSVGLHRVLAAESAARQERHQGELGDAYFASGKSGYLRADGDDDG
jgi:hypothetical protein